MGDHDVDRYSDPQQLRVFMKSLLTDLRAPERMIAEGDGVGLPVITLINVLDVNYDGIVDRQDDSLIYSNQGQDPSVVGPIYDTNGDGQIDIWDQIPCPPPPALVSSPVSGVGNPYAFTGRRMDRIIKNNMAALLLYHYRAREYDPHHGRFMQRDPAGYVPTMNLYEYANCRPTTWADPTGKWGPAMHYTRTKQLAEHVGMKRKCAEVIAAWDQGVDDMTGASLFPWYHFNKDVDGNAFACGRDCWLQRRWDKGIRKLKTATTWFGLRPSVYDGLAHIGEAMHHLQDSFTHRAGGQRSIRDAKPHMAETPFDHAPSVFCLLWGDAFGVIYQRCKDARTSNPNWGDPHRPDSRPHFPNDWATTEQTTRNRLKTLMGIKSMQCYCKK